MQLAAKGRKEILDGFHDKKDAKVELQRAHEHAPAQAVPQEDAHRPGPRGLGRLERAAARGAQPC